MSELPNTKMERLNFEAGLSRGLKDVEEKTNLPYPTLINCNRGFQIVKDKIMPYKPSRGTQRILVDFYGKPWNEIYEDRYAMAIAASQAGASPAASQEAINESFTINPKNGKSNSKQKNHK